ncbi:alpha/beta hydrolase like protein [Babesia gibsoni]|uniref:Alpha/beta hydrolase like protein n=1 Tax=Babesia gibsoni TaxID=33632 RepID=A0AAD8PCQ8_BABGI|nr:alpha/beta hydrolase like protein [Babesia gibsoni]
MKGMLRVVFLHGFTQTDETLRARSAVFRKKYAQYLDIKYVNSPHPLKIAPGFITNYEASMPDNKIIEMEDIARTNYVKEQGFKEAYGHTWYYTEKPGQCSLYQKHAEVIGLEESIKVIIDACKEHEADGIMGFSQGGMMTVLAAQRAMQDDSLGWKPKFAVLFGAASIRNEKVHKMAEEGVKMRIPSLHVVSEKDPYVRPERSYTLLKYFYEPELAFHDEGHSIPSNEASDKYTEFFRRIVDSGQQSREAVGPQA